MTIDRALCEKVIAGHDYPLLFATVSGAHLYGFPSPDSDYDLRGVHLLPPAELLGLGTPRETIESPGIVGGIQIDLVTHDAGKFFRMMLRNNGYVLEQLLSPLVIRSSPEHEELRRLAAGCITRHHAHHYLGFAESQWRLFEKEQSPRVKPLLYTYRVLLTGIHLMRTGEIEPNLQRLSELYNLGHVRPLIEAKVLGAEQTTAQGIDRAFHEQEYLRLRSCLESEAQCTQLPEKASVWPQLDRLLVQLRSGVGLRH